MRFNDYTASTRQRWVRSYKDRNQSLPWKSTSIKWNNRWPLVCELNGFLMGFVVVVCDMARQTPLRPTSTPPFCVVSGGFQWTFRCPLSLVSGCVFFLPDESDRNPKQTAPRPRSPSSFAFDLMAPDFRWNLQFPIVVSDGSYHISIVSLCCFFVSILFSYAYAYAFLTPDPLIFSSYLILIIAVTPIFLAESDRKINRKRLKRTTRRLTPLPTSTTSYALSRTLGPCSWITTRRRWTAVLRTALLRTALRSQRWTRGCSMSWSPTPVRNNIYWYCCTTLSGNVEAVWALVLR